MKRFLIVFLALFLLCGCEKENDKPLNNSSVIVNLSTPKQNETQAPTEVQEISSSGRYYLKLATTEITGGSISSNAKLVLRYTNMTSSPIYSLSFLLCDGISINSVSVNSVATNYTVDKESKTLAVPVGTELLPRESLVLYISYTVKEARTLSDAVLRFSESQFLKHTVSVTVDSTYEVTSSLGTPQVSEGTKKTFTFTAESENNFTLELK